ncbi:MAG: ATP phosphoribosyltransferase regulatory subunit [Oscillospiraceae bacterium]|jgi:ATP phosphoribosyltransferase regulatory subunit|nr:ATP phosphoribosyltransferase regulatory subunit [Oscillospiraceae bacterium]
MRESIIRAPEGTRDRLFDECVLRREREAGLFELFQNRGFREVSTPVLEHYELFTRTGSPLSEETMVKVLSRSGRICVLRPDNTAPIARLAATRLQNEPLPLKLWYAQPVYRARDGGCFEVPQAGAEVIGGGDDAELLLLARETAAFFYGQTPHIEISHAGVLQTLLERMELDGGQTEHVLSLIERKNFAALGDELPGGAQGLLSLVSLSGGAETLDEAAGCAGVPIDKPLGELRGLLSALPDGAVTVDFGLVPSLSYYTGVFFRGYVGGAAGAVLTGGRYDRLLGLLGRDLPAVGFAVQWE